MSEDNAVVNVPLSKRYGKGGIDGALIRYNAEQNRIAAEESRAKRQAAREAEANRERLTFDDVVGAKYVRDGFRWHKVVRVNAKSVTVETPYSWTDRIALDKIHEVRR